MRLLMISEILCFPNLLARSIEKKSIFAAAYLPLIALVLTGCVGPDIENSDSSTGTEAHLDQRDESLTEQVCNGDTMPTGKENCEPRGTDYWTEERMRKAEPTPMPKVETPDSPPLNDESREGTAAPVSGASDTPVVEQAPHPLVRSQCEDEAGLGDKAEEACEQRGEEYWTEERRRAAKATPSPVAPLPDHLKPKEKPAVPNDEAVSQSGQPPLIVTPTPENRN